MLWPERAADFGGQVWGAEVEVTAKTAQRTAGIMAELLARSQDYDGTPGTLDGRPRYARVLYVCSPAALGVARRARGMLPGERAGRVEVRLLPEGAL